MPINNPPAIASALGVGSKTISVTGVAVPLMAVPTPCSRVYMSTIKTNSAELYWGSAGVSSTDGDYVFPATKLPPIEIDDVSKIYINGTAGDGVKFTWSV